MCVCVCREGEGGEGGTPYNGLYRKGPSQRGAFSGFRYLKG